MFCVVKIPNLPPHPVRMQRRNADRYAIKSLNLLQKRAHGILSDTAHAWSWGYFKTQKLQITDFFSLRTFKMEICVKNDRNMPDTFARKF